MKLPTVTLELVLACAAPAETEAALRSLGFESAPGDGLLHASMAGFELDPVALVQHLSAIPFEFASFAPIHAAWLDGRLGAPYSSPSFGLGHRRHGWACAFQGRGHNRLVSRRALNHGPWRTLRGASDTTLIQFHDLTLDPWGAWEQARPAHRLMGPSPVGAFMPEPYQAVTDFSASIHKGRLCVDVPPQRSVSSIEMRDAVHARRSGRVEDVTYRFSEADAAARALYRLWWYGIECRLLRPEGDEEVLVPELMDETPDWVRAQGRRDMVPVITTE